MIDPNIETEPRPRITRTHLILLGTAMAITGLAWGTYYVLTHKDAADYLQAAEMHTARGDARSAIIALKNALQLEPANADARYQLGKLYVSVHDYLAAEKELKLAHDKGHTAPDLSPLLARTWLALGQPGRVLDELPVPEDATPEQAAPLLALRARAQWLRNDATAAEASLQQADTLRPGDTETLLTRALMAAAGNSPERALALVDQALGQDAKRAELWMLKGDLHRQAKHRSEAQSAYRKALELEPDHVAVGFRTIA